MKRIVMPFTAVLTWFATSCLSAPVPRGDDNCNGDTDELGSAGCTTFYFDGDGDGYGDAPEACSCTAPVDYVAPSGDCADDDAAIHPGAVDICNGLDDDCDTAFDEDCNCTYGHFGGALFAACVDERTWDEALAQCGAMGGTLAQPKGDAALNNWLWDLASSTGAFGSDYVWLGLTDRDVEGTFVWVDGTVLDPADSHWHTLGVDDEPNDGGGGLYGEDCVSFTAEPSLWNDYVCDFAQPFLCAL